MAKGGSNSGDAFDLRRIKRLIELMDEHGLTELDLRQGDTRVRLRRKGQASAPVPGPIASAESPQGPAGGARQAQGGAGGKAPADSSLVEIKSPMVGTFYRASSPDAEPYVQIGSHVEPQTTVCVIEAMKVFNEIPAEVSGTIAEILVSNGEPVEFGQPLYRVRPPS